jgi:hypothetical protein
MDAQPDESSLYLNRKTGKVALVTEEAMQAVEDEESLEEHPEWPKETIQVARDILADSENYVELPSKYEIHEYRIMEDFCHSIEDRQISETLSKAIRGRGAFGRFRDHIMRFGIAVRWDKFKAEALKAIAKEWCEDNDIDYIDA